MFFMYLVYFHNNIINFIGYKNVLPNLPDIRTYNTDIIEKILNSAYQRKHFTISYNEEMNPGINPVIQEMHITCFSTNNK